jgi:hypothetical protein
MGIGDWGLGIGDWGLGPIPNPQSPIPNPHKLILFLICFKYIFKFLKNMGAINVNKKIFFIII